MTSKRFKKLLPIVSRIISYIESRVGGTVFPSDDGKKEIVTFKWKRYDIKSSKMLQLNYAVTYAELENIVVPVIIAKKIVEVIKKGE